MCAAGPTKSRLANIQSPFKRQSSSLRPERNYPAHFCPPKNPLNNVCILAGRRFARSHRRSGRNHHFPGRRAICARAAHFHVEGTCFSCSHISIARSKRAANYTISTFVSSGWNASKSVSWCAAAFSAREQVPARLPASPAKWIARFQFASISIDN